jgi:hypothetical protein
MSNLKKIAPKLSEINKEQPFGVPKNYFDDFPARLHAKIEAEKHAPLQKQNSVIRYLKPALGLAAGFAMIFLIVYWPIKSFLPAYLAKKESYIEQTTNNEDIYLSYIEKLDESSFFSLLNGNGESILTGFNDEDLLSYISSNVSDYEIYIYAEN